MEENRLKHEIYEILEEAVDWWGKQDTFSMMEVNMMKSYRKTAKGFDHTLELPILSKEELFEALVLRADHVFKADFIGYNYAEKKALCRCLLDSLPRSLQEKLLAYTVTIMSKDKFTCTEIAKSLREQGLLREKKCSLYHRIGMVVVN